jgi:8-oxo-dGTP pyrophosphatase MutT (NUDIX family)
MASTLIHEHFPKLYSLLSCDTAHDRIRFYDMLKQVDFNTAENRKSRYSRMSAVEPKKSAVLMCFPINPNIIPSPIRLLVLQKQPKDEKRNANYIYGGQPCFPGGTFDATVDLTLKDTAIRESQEEIGYLHQLSILNESFPEALTGAGLFSVKTFIASFQTTGKPYELQRNEIANAFEIDFKALIDGYEKYGVVTYPGYGDFIGPVFNVTARACPTVDNSDYNNQKYVDLRIWGYTGSIIEKFCRTIEQELAEKWTPKL